MHFHNSLIRNIDAGELLEDFLVAAVSSVLGIRFWLHLTGFPQLGGRSFHFAHMLFGGFFMLVSIILLLTYLNRKTVQMAAILGGIGFGTFIDELGKFITRDNNYFYQPTIAFIYVIFIVLFLLFQVLEHENNLTEKEYLLNALDHMEDVVLQDLDREEKKRVRQILTKCDPDDPLVKTLKELVKKTEAEPSGKGPFTHVMHTINTFYRSIIQNRWFSRGVIVFFLTKAVLALLSVLTLIQRLIANPYFFSIHPNFAFLQWGEVISSIASGALIIIGAFSIYKSRVYAYQMFRRSILISIFFTQFFLFYQQQLSAIVLLIVNLLILFSLQYMIDQEKLLKEE